MSEAAGPLPCPYLSSLNPEAANLFQPPCRKQNPAGVICFTNGTGGLS
jgi:hypothetical protein